MSHLKGGIRWAVSLGLLIWLFSKLDLQVIGHVLQEARVAFAVAAILAGWLLVAGISSRLWLFLRLSGIRVSWSGVARVTWTGQFLNSMLPGSTGGDAYKIYELERLIEQQPGVGAAAVLADRLCALIGLVLLAAASAMFSRVPWFDFIGGTLAVRTGLILTGLAGVSGFVALWYYRRALVSRFPQAARLIALADGALIQVGVYFRKPDLIGVSILTALVLHVGNFCIVYFLARSLNLTLSFLQVASLMPVLMLVLLLPLTVNGHGLREVVLVGFFTWLGVTRNVGLAVSPRELAITLSIMLVATDLVCNLPGGLWSLWHRRNDAPREPIQQPT